MEGVSNAALLAELRAICGSHERAIDLLNELGDRLEDEPWSVPADVLGELRKAYPEAHTIQAFCRRARFAHRVWLDKYGPFNVEQGNYVRELLLWAIQASEGNRGKLHGKVEDLVNHEHVDLGFKKRADSTVVEFDVMELLQ